MSRGKKAQEKNKAPSHGRYPCDHLRYARPTCVTHHFKPVKLCKLSLLQQYCCIESNRRTAVYNRSYNRLRRGQSTVTVCSFCAVARHYAVGYRACGHVAWKRAERQRMRNASAKPVRKDAFDNGLLFRHKRGAVTPSCLFAAGFL